MSWESLNLNIWVEIRFTLAISQWRICDDWLYKTPGVGAPIVTVNLLESPPNWQPCWPQSAGNLNQVAPDSLWSSNSHRKLAYQCLWCWIYLWITAKFNVKIIFNRIKIKILIPALTHQGWARHIWDNALLSIRCYSTRPIRKRKLYANVYSQCCCSWYPSTCSGNQF